MKILKIWPFWQEEIKYHDHYLADEMYKQGIETTFLVPDKIPKSLYPFLKQTNVSAGESYYNKSKVVRLKSIDFGGKYIITELYKMHKIVNSGYDVIHIFGISNVITFLTLIMLTLKQNKTIVFINDHNNPVEDNKSFLAKIYYKLFKLLYSIFSHKIKKIIVPNKASFDYIKKRYDIHNDDKLLMIPLGYDNNIFKYTKERNLEDKLILGYAGKIVPEKEIEKLLNVLVNFNQNDIHCIIVGFNIGEYSEYQKNLLHLKEKLKLRNVEFRSFIDNPKKLSQFYNHIDLAIFPGSISITTLEANGCGTPIILFNSIDGLEDRVENIRGELFLTKEELSTLITRYISMKRNKEINHDKIEQLSSIYSWEKLSSIYLNTYCNFLKKATN